MLCVFANTSVPIKELLKILHNYGGYLTLIIEKRLNVIHENSGFLTVKIINYTITSFERNNFYFFYSNIYIGRHLFRIRI